MKHFLMTILILLQLNPWAQEDGVWLDAQKKFMDGNYSEAVELLLSVESQLKDHAEYHYNLGTAYGRMGELPYAILHLEKCLKMDPGHGDAAKNLRWCRTQIPQLKPRIESVKFWGTLKRISRSCPGGVWFGIFLFLTVIGIWTGGKFKNAMPKWVVLGILAICAATSLLMMVLEEQQLTENDRYILMNNHKLHVAADELAPSVGELMGGEELYELDRIGDWMKIRLPNLEEGWVKTEWIQQI